MTYPIAMSSDTSGLSEIPGKALTLAKAYPEISGGTLGALVGHLAGHTLVGALIGVTGGYFFKKSQS